MIEFKLSALLTWAIIVLFLLSGIWFLDSENKKLKQELLTLNQAVSAWEAKGKQLTLNIANAQVSAQRQRSEADKREKRLVNASPSSCEDAASFARVEAQELNKVWAQ